MTTRLGRIKFFLGRYFEEFGLLEKARIGYEESVKYLSYLEKSKKLYIEDFMKWNDKFFKEVDWFKKLLKEGWKEDQNEF